MLSTSVFFTGWALVYVSPQEKRCLVCLPGRGVSQGTRVQGGGSHRFPGSSFLPFDTERSPARRLTGSSQTAFRGRLHMTDESQSCNESE